MPATTLAPTPLFLWRTGAGLTRKEAGERLGRLVGKERVSQTAWKDWEEGRGRPSLALAIAIEVLTEGLVQVESWGHSAEPALRLAAMRREREAKRRRAESRGAKLGAEGAP